MGEDADDLVGQPVERAAAIAAERGRAPDQEAAAARLVRIAEDGVVTWAGAERALDTVELPAGEELEAALERARDAAAGEANRAVVAARLERFEDRVDELSSERAAMTDRRDELSARIEAGDDLFGVARALDRFADTAEAAREAHADLRAELDAFEAWLAHPAARLEELQTDVEALAEALEDLAATADALAAARAQGQGDSDEYAAAWFETLIRHRAMAVMLEDLRWELESLQTWEPAPEGEDLAARLDALADRREAVGRAVNDVTEPRLVHRFSSALAEVDAAFEALSPPVEWAAVEETLEAHRQAAVDGDAEAGTGS